MTVSDSPSRKNSRIRDEFNRFLQEHSAEIKAIIDRFMTK
jgi:hypothetical protein